MENKAPEEIYVHIKNNKITNTWNSTFIGVHDIAYVRKDAFIEKAVKFMEKIDDVDEYSWYNEEEHAAGITEECIEDFKKYIKGE